MDVFSEVLIVNIPMGDIQPTLGTKWLRSNWLMDTVQKIDPLKKGYLQIKTSLNQGALN